MTLEFHASRKDGRAMHAENALMDQAKLRAKRADSTSNAGTALLQCNARQQEMVAAHACTV